MAGQRILQRKELDVGNHPDGKLRLTRPDDLRATRDRNVSKRSVIRRFHAQFTLMSAAVTTARHLAISERIYTNSSGVPVTGSIPNDANFSFIAGFCTILINSRLSFATMSGGRPAGPRNPYHDVASSPGTPASASARRPGRPDN